jgi:hypothetical protein
MDMRPFGSAPFCRLVARVKFFKRQSKDFEKPAIASQSRVFFETERRPVGGITKAKR